MTWQMSIKYRLFWINFSLLLFSFSSFSASTFQQEQAINSFIEMWQNKDLIEEYPFNSSLLLLKNAKYKLINQKLFPCQYPKSKGWQVAEVNKGGFTKEIVIGKNTIKVKAKKLHRKYSSKYRPPYSTRVLIWVFTANNLSEKQADSYTFTWTQRGEQANKLSSPKKVTTSYPYFLLMDTTFLDEGFNLESAHKTNDPNETWTPLSISGHEPLSPNDSFLELPPLFPALPSQENLQEQFEDYQSGGENDFWLQERFLEGCGKDEI